MSEKAQHLGAHIRQFGHITPAGIEPLAAMADTLESSLAEVTRQRDQWMEEADKDTAELERLDAALTESRRMCDTGSAEMDKAVAQLNLLLQQRDAARAELAAAREQTARDGEATRELHAECARLYEHLHALTDAPAPAMCCEHCHVPPAPSCPTFEAGMNGRCVYCDHAEQCHPGPNLSGPLGDATELVMLCLTCGAPVVSAPHPCGGVPGGPECPQTWVKASEERVRALEAKRQGLADDALAILPHVTMFDRYEHRLEADRVLAALAALTALDRADG
jgi:hypothetical protein